MRVEWYTDSPGRVRLLRIALALFYVAGASLLLGTFSRVYPIQHWLFWRYAGYWLSALTLLSTSTAAGYRVTCWLGHRRAGLERWTLAFGVGLLLAALGVFIFGVLGLVHPALFAALPLLLALLGGRRPWRDLKRLVVLARHARRRRPRARAFEWLVICLGLLGLTMIYLNILTPENIQFDARWRHLAMADHYAATGRVGRFVEGWVPGTAPQLASYLYTWCWLLPWARLFDRVELCAHLEYAIFLTTTLLSTVAVVRRLIPRANPTLVWTARLAFPSIYLYDSSLSGGADHIGAAFGPAIFLALLAALRHPGAKSAWLLGVLLAAAALVKETVVVLLVPIPALALVVACLVRALRGRTFKALLPALHVALAGFVVTSVHWLKNLIYYGDPVYPMGHRWFPTQPFVAENMRIFDQAFLREALWRPTADWFGVWQTVELMGTFSFIPHDWPGLHRDWPVFGSLFTLLLLSLLLFRGTRRLWGLVGWVQGSLVLWFWMNHQDRYLQTLVPLMAAVVAAIATLAFRKGGPWVRGALAMMVGVQIVGAGDTYFIQTHTMIREAPLKRVIALLEGGFRQQYDQRFRFFGSLYEEVGNDLPPKAKLLAHEYTMRVGLGVDSVVDRAPEQMAIYWPGYESPHAAWKHLHSLGVTHVSWATGKSEGFNSLADDIAFFEFVHHVGRQRRTRAGATIVSIMAEPRPAPAAKTVLVVTCTDQVLKSGIYQREDLVAPPMGSQAYQYPDPRTPLPNLYLIQRAMKTSYLAITEEGCKDLGMPRSGMLQVAKRVRNPPGMRPLEIWIRTSVQSAVPRLAPRF